MNNEGNNSFRFDCEQVPTFDLKSGKISLSLIPNRNRYKWRVKDGCRELLDTFDNLIFPESLVIEMLEEAQKMHSDDYQEQLLNSVDEYYEGRIEIINSVLKTRDIPLQLSDKSEEFLEGVNSKTLKFVIISLDIVQSTQLSIQLNQEDYSFIISLIIFELSNVIPKFHGHVLKYTGDGLIAYFPEPIFITKNDLAIDCALTLRGLVYKVINKVFLENHLPKIDIRIGLDAGEAFIATMGSPETKQHKDIIGLVVNLATKIQSRADTGKIYLGETVEKNLHTDWRKLCKPVSLEHKSWEYKYSDGSPYRIFEIDV